MIDLSLDQNKIQEIRYTLKDGKSAIFKLCDSVLEDVEIENLANTGDTKEKCEKPKQLHDYEPFSCLKTEKGMQETLDASRKKEWKEDVITKPSKPTETGNALVPVDYTLQKLKKKEDTEKNESENR